MRCSLEAENVLWFFSVGVLEGFYLHAMFFVPDAVRRDWWMMTSTFVRAQGGKGSLNHST